MSCHFHNAVFITSGKNHQEKKKIMIVERLLERAAFLSERMGRPVSHPLDVNQRDTNVPQNMHRVLMSVHRTLGEPVSDSWGHFFLVMAEKAV